MKNKKSAPTVVNAPKNANSDCQKNLNRIRASNTPAYHSIEIRIFSKFQKNDIARRYSHFTDKNTADSIH